MDNGPYTMSQQGRLEMGVQQQAKLGSRGSDIDRSQTSMEVEFGHIVNLGKLHLQFSSRC